jgi:hypothetical protein
VITVVKYILKNLTIYLQDPMLHLNIVQEGDYIEVWGPATQFPNIQAVLPRLKFFKRELGRSPHRPFALTGIASNLLDKMRATSSLDPGSYHTMNLDNIKRYIISQAEEWTGGDDDGSSGAARGGTPAGSPHKTSFGGGKTSFSPKKQKALDTRPAILARKSWTITINRDAGTVTVTGSPPFSRFIFFKTLISRPFDSEQDCTTFTGA